MRELTPERRRALGLASATPPPYRWGFAAFVVGLVAVPLVLAKLHGLAFAAALVGLVLVPLVRVMEARERAARDRVFTEGAEEEGVVGSVEPGGDRPVHVTLDSGRALVVRGCPLARRGLGPGDRVRLYVLGERALIVDRVAKPDAGGAAPGDVNPAEPA